jgi:hypothetical protein
LLATLKFDATELVKDLLKIHAELSVWQLSTNGLVLGVGTPNRTGVVQKARVSFTVKPTKEGSYVELVDIN